MLASAKSTESRSVSLLSDMDHLEVAIGKLQEMLQRISEYVDSVVVSFIFKKDGEERERQLSMTTLRYCCYN